VFSYRLRWDLVADNVGGLVSGLVILLQITALGFALAMILGLVVAVARTARSPLLRGPALAYTELMRGIPLFLFLFLVYYGAAQVSPVVLSPFVAAVLALGLTGSGYATEIYRGALQAVDPGQREAAFAMGLTPGQAFRDVVLPQALRIAVPPGMNLLVALLKGSTFVSVIGVADVFYLSRIVSQRFFAPFEMYTVSGLMIIAVTLCLAGFAVLVEKRFARGDRTSS
jgi:His/Glu/Gln/Arg/opine family amino acid ABC transporter permease subunit